MTLWLLTRGDPLLFVLLSGVVFFGWGEIFSLFPSTLTDTFGTRHATQQLRLPLYRPGHRLDLRRPDGVAAARATGAWGPVFGVAIAADLLTAALALVVLKPMRAAYLQGLAGRR